VTIGSALSLVVIAASVCVCALLLVPVMRRRLRVYLSKHFLSSRYDYRKEWLRLIETLVGRANELPLRTRAVKALAEIVGSNQGELWMRSDDSSDFEPYGSWSANVQMKSIRKDHELATYLRRSRWVIDTVEYNANPAIYSHAFSADAPFLRETSIYVPIVSREELIGIVRIERPQGLGDLSYEDHDLLKTAGQQVAVFLVHEQAQEQLFETRQFEAYSKLTAFLMHDLKNVIAQQSLVVSNARNFRHRPEFIDDAMKTIEASVNRMRKILERLQGATRTEKSTRFDLVELVQDVCESCTDRAPTPRMIVPGDRVMINTDRERLTMALIHLVRNAQDATDDSGRISVSLSIDDSGAMIEVLDSGCGMDAEFIRNRLFRPFDSTKGAQGVGIGAYQIRETIKAIGGGIEVESSIGVGTNVRLRLPCESRVVT